MCPESRIPPSEHCPSTIIIEEKKAEVGKMTWGTSRQTNQVVFTIL
jgi:hypothetical protein